jgi:ABC-type branched-subunit amino acid transport system substrate-binding protein
LPLLKSYHDQSVYLLFPFTGAQPHRQPPYGEYVFNLRASYQEETEGLVNHFVSVGRKRVGVFYQADAYGRSGWDGVRNALVKNDGLKIVAEATYRRGTSYSARLNAQVDILKNAAPDAVISIGSYAACAAFIRDARDAGWRVPIANVSFVGSESLAALLLETGRATGKDYTQDLINSQVVPSYEDTSLPSVREYRELMGTYNPRPPAGMMDQEYEPFSRSFVSFEGFLNAKLLVEILKGMGEKAGRSRVKEVVEGIRDLDLGMGAPISFGPYKHQGLDKVYYTTLSNGRFVPLASWERWEK